MEQKVVQKAPEQAKKPTPNLTGIPTQMKLDFERRSGLSFDDVRVHYNSDKPRKIGALAYTQGNQVHVGPCQERHLRHELGHVVQQKRGLVQPTTWINGLPVNDSPDLERAAEIVTYNSFLQTNAYSLQPIVQGFFEVVFENNRWGTRGDTRAILHKDIEKEFETMKKMMGISAVRGEKCHIIPDKFIRSFLRSSIIDKLNNETYAEIKSPDIPSGVFTMEQLRELVRAVIPDNLKVPEEYEQAYAQIGGSMDLPAKSLKQQKNALSIVFEIEQLFNVTPKTMNPLLLSEKVNYLYEILANAYANIRFGGQGHNRSIGGKFDPVLRGVFARFEKAIDAAGTSRTVAKITLLKGAPYNMAERMQSLRKLYDSTPVTLRTDYFFPIRIQYAIEQIRGPSSKRRHSEPLLRSILENAAKSKEYADKTYADRAKMLIEAAINYAEESAYRRARENNSSNSTAEAAKGTMSAIVSAALQLDYTGISQDINIGDLAARVIELEHEVTTVPYIQSSDSHDSVDSAYLEDIPLSDIEFESS